MGRHSRRGPAPKGDPADIDARRRDQRGTRSEDARREARAQGSGPGVAGGTPGQNAPGFPDGTPAHGTPSAQGMPRLPDGTPAHGVPRLPDGTPAHGVPVFPDGTPARGVPRLREGAPVRGGHPEQREAGGGWGDSAGRAGAGRPGVVLPRQRQAGPDGPRRGKGPRQEYLDAFEGADEGSGAVEDLDVFASRTGRVRGGRQRPAPQEQPLASAADGATVPAQRGDGDAVSGQRQGNKGRAFTGIAAAAVTTVLAVIVAGQVTEGDDDGAAQSQSATGHAPDAQAPAGPAPSVEPSATPLTYDQKMGATYPLSATLKGPGKFDAVPGSDKAPGTGQKYRYRVDIEQGMGLDGGLFAEAVQKTLNDKRSWAHGGARTFERISSGKPDFVITLASPGTTATWCAKSGLDTTEDNVSCDSAATERVMINAYRWAQGSKTYGDKIIHAYRQMLINHEVGHRLGNGHVSCQKDGELAPVMQQQTKFLDHDGIHCRPNPWPYPTR
ncbi:DUF3152 domain-containing protein [Streptomyces actinomycinicus]|uniref:DUF3152 domain-containing protein n=1 Tax=Streptomyces actinomycinicus TaxID=1695166 RepID=A0A937JRC8_9ACTN|nr:DUF3152 domain-containing protein [Streptomyces actinomycinicus]MBL1085512.1 DUF3152 domain-containing protein [Streptomyces actinomycinicus]